MLRCCTPFRGGRRVASHVIAATSGSAATSQNRQKAPATLVSGSQRWRRAALRSTAARSQRCRRAALNSTQQARCSTAAARATTSTARTRREWATTTCASSTARSTATALIIPTRRAIIQEAARTVNRRARPCPLYDNRRRRLYKCRRKRPATPMLLATGNALIATTSIGRNGSSATNVIGPSPR